MEVVHTEHSSQAIGPYSQALVVDGWVYTSGAVGLTPQNQPVGEDVQEQTRQTLANLSAVLEAAGCTLQDVVKATVYLVDMDEFPLVNEIYAEYFTASPRPARSTVQVAALPLGSQIEIDAIARSS